WIMSVTWSITYVRCWASGKAGRPNNEHVGHDEPSLAVVRHCGLFMKQDTEGKTTVRVAGVEAAPILFDTPKSLQKLADLTADAARQRAGLVVFPEAFVGGYPKGHDFGVSLGMRSPEGREAFRLLFENAIQVPGPVVDFLGKVARE